ncbi:hypothetical protein CLAIMM_11090 [Cladophialophora immunda]|nr:hypothetical protein CLAIMM_11090 [Cladophialophora immunda]
MREPCHYSVLRKQQAITRPTVVELKPEDGYCGLAQFDSEGVKLIAQLEQVQPTEYGHEDIYLVQFKVDLMSSVAQRKRIQAADFDIKISPLPEHGEQTPQEQKPTTPDQDPQIVVVSPEIQLWNVSEREISVEARKSLLLSANATTFAGASIGAENTARELTKFDGVVTIHGVIKNGKDTACWRIREDSASKSGVPQSLRLVAGVRAKAGFQIQVLRLEAHVRERKRFWKLRILSARSTAIVQINPLDKLLAQILHATTERAKQLLAKTTSVATQARSALKELHEKADSTIKELEANDLANHGQHVEGALRLVEDIANACQGWRNPLNDGRLKKDEVVFDALTKRIIEAERHQENEEAQRNQGSREKTREQLQDEKISEQLASTKEDLRRIKRQVHLTELKGTLEKLNRMIANENTEQAEIKSAMRDAEELASRLDTEPDISYQRTRQHYRHLIEGDGESSSESGSASSSDSDSSSDLGADSDTDYDNVNAHHHLHEHYRRRRHGRRNSPLVVPQTSTVISTRRRIKPEELRSFSAVGGYSIKVL